MDLLDIEADHAERAQAFAERLRERLLAPGPTAKSFRLRPLARELVIDAGAASELVDAIAKLCVPVRPVGEQEPPDPGELGGGWGESTFGSTESFDGKISQKDPDHFEITDGLDQAAALARAQALLAELDALAPALFETERRRDRAKRLVHALAEHLESQWPEPDAPACGAKGSKTRGLWYREVDAAIQAALDASLAERVLVIAEVVDLLVPGEAVDPESIARTLRSPR